MDQSCDTNSEVSGETPKVEIQQNEPQFASPSDLDPDKTSSDEDPELFFSCDDDDDTCDDRFLGRRRSKSENCSPEAVATLEEEHGKGNKKKSSFGALLRQCSLPKLSIGKKTTQLTLPNGNLPNSLTCPNLHDDANK